MIKAIEINLKKIKKIIIDDHVDKHSDHITDELIKKLIQSLSGECFTPVKELNGFQYYATVVCEKEKWYKLVWLTEKNSDYIGVLTAFRDRRIK